MTKPHTLLFTLFGLSSVALVLSSCDGDDDTIGTSGGGAGKPATGGSAGTSGSSAQAGTGGKGGTSGSGSSEGGAGASQSGAGGESAQSGSGGSVSGGRGGKGGNPGASGNAPGGGGNGAEAGSTENGGAGAGGAPAELLVCKTGCIHAEDCASSEAENAVCDETLHLCVECVEHADCTAKANGWNLPCTSDAGCAEFFPACIDVDGSGFCAPVPDETFGCIVGTSVPYPHFGIVPAEQVDVCVVDSGRCTSQHRCITGCTDQADFCTSVSPGHGDTCDEITGECQCTNDDECEPSLTGTLHCNPTTHRCDECATNDDCVGAATGEECHEGRCGCSSIAACPAGSFPAGTTLCE